MLKLLCLNFRLFDALRVYIVDTESISGIIKFRKFRLMPISLPLGTSETFVVSSCRDVRGELALRALVSAFGVRVKTMSCRLFTDR